MRDEPVEVSARVVRAPVEARGVLAPSADQLVQTGFSAAAVRFVIESYAVRVGDRVEAGDVLATLVSPQADVRVAQEQSMSHLLESQLRDARRNARGAEGALAVEAAELRVAQSRAALEGLRIGLGRPVRSPIAGIVAELPPVSTESGYAQTVARIVRTDPLRLEVALPLGDATPAAGTRLEVTVGTVRAEGVVRGVSPLADRDGRIVLAMELPNPDGRLAAGLRASVTVDVGRWQGLIVPASAVVQTADGPAVWAAEVPAPRLRPVEVVGAVEDEVAVVGLSAGERVLRRPPHDGPWSG